MKASPLIERYRSRHLLKNPSSATHPEIAAMGAEIERLHARIRRLKDRNGQLEAMLVAVGQSSAESIRADAVTFNISHASFGDDRGKVARRPPGDDEAETPREQAPRDKGGA